MAQEETQLLLKDLCARLPHEVQAEGLYEEYNDNDEIIQIKTCGVVTGIFHNIVTIGINDDCKLGTVKPYLRPMSNMTEEEWKEYDWFVKQESDELIRFRNTLKFYNKHHIDYNDLIPKGLALEAPNGMYN